LGRQARRRGKEARKAHQGPASDATQPWVALSSACGPPCGGGDPFTTQAYDLRRNRRHIARWQRPLPDSCRLLLRTGEPHPLDRRGRRSDSAFAGDARADHPHCTRGQPCRTAMRKGIRDHYYVHELRTPAEVRRAVRYVLDNAALHAGSDPQTDPCASTEPLVAPQTWLLRIGWLRSRAGPLPVNLWDDAAAPPAAVHGGPDYSRIQDRT